jgi:hypothetical protein
MYATSVEMPEPLHGMLFASFILHRNVFYLLNDDLGDFDFAAAFARPDGDSGK